MSTGEMLNKIVVLYMLKRVSFPMSLAELWTFFNEQGEVPEEEFRTTIVSLKDANLLNSEEMNGVIRYELTKGGEEALHHFGDRIPEEIVAQIESYVTANKFRLRNETGASTEYYKTESGEYEVHLKVREQKITLFEMKLAVPTEEQAKVLASHLTDNAQAIYAYVMRKVV